MYKGILRQKHTQQPALCSRTECFSLHVQKFSLLGSTGSIGTQTLDIVREHNDKFEIVAIAAGRNIVLLAGAAAREPSRKLRMK